MVTADGDVVAADAVLNIDDDALFRHEDLAAMEEEAAAAAEEEAAADEVPAIKQKGEEGEA